MASAMRKMAVYLGLVEDDHRYGDPYTDEYGDADDYGDYITEYADQASATETHAGYAADDGRGRTDQRPAAEQMHAADLARITTLHPRTYNEARTIGEHFREGTPVIMNLTEMENADAKRLVDFAAGLAFALRGSMDKVTNKVFLLSPPDVDVTAEDRRRIAEGGLFLRG